MIVLGVASQYGALECIMPVLERLDDTRIILPESMQSLAGIQRYLDDIYSLKEVSIVIAGTNNCGNLEDEVINAAKKLSIPTIAFLDSTSEIKDRFLIEGVADHLIIPGFAKKAASFLRTNTQIHIFGNPHYDQLFEFQKKINWHEAMNIPRMPIYIFAMAPEVDVLSQLDVLQSIMSDNKDIYFIVKPHFRHNDLTLKIQSSNVKVLMNGDKMLDYLPYATALINPYATTGFWDALYLGVIPVSLSNFQRYDKKMPSMVVTYTGAIVPAFSLSDIGTGYSDREMKKMMHAYPIDGMSTKRALALINSLI